MRNNSITRSIRSSIVSTYLLLILISMTVLGIMLIWLLPNYYRSETLFKFLGFLLSGIIIATLVGILFCIKLAKGLTEPLENISRGAKRIAEGDWDTRVYSGTNNEIGQLGQAINLMTKTLKHQIDEVSQEKSRLENIVNTMGSGVIVLDNYGLVQMLNRAAEEMFGVSFVTAEGRHNLEVIRHFGLNDQIEKCLIKEKVIDYEFNFSHLHEKTVKCYIAPVYRDKAISGITMVFHDITQLRKLEKMRADFVANASHELRTPLTVIKGYAETLLGGAIEEKTVREKFVSIIDQEADRLQRLVDELLTLSRVESREQDNNIKPVDLVELVNNVTEEIKPRFSEKGISLHVEIQQNFPPVQATYDRLKQVIVNLLDNALKYTPAGGEVRVAADEDGEYIEVFIKDTGIGIPAKDLQRVFERFYRVDKARGRQMGGFGLGLSIVKHIVETLGGQIGVTSSLNEGSTFWLKLPKYID